jgi:hypothetical protein
LSDLAALSGDVQNAKVWRYLCRASGAHLLAGGEMTEREALLEGALVANAAIRVQAEQLIAAYVVPESDREAIINELIALFDGPQQREAERLTAVALGA